MCALADLKMNRLLDTFDEWARESGQDADPGPPERFEPTRVPERHGSRLDLRAARSALVWATGFRPDYRWLDVPVLDRKGGLRHDGGVVDAPGLYALGLPFLRRRKSSFIHGAEDDARDIARASRRISGVSLVTACRHATPLRGATSWSGLSAACASFRLPPLCDARGWARRVDEGQRLGELGGAWS